MKLNEVLLKYHNMVPFPVTRRKIKKAGFEPYDYLKELLEDIVRAEDFNPHRKTDKEIFSALKELKEVSKDGKIQRLARY